MSQRHDYFEVAQQLARDQFVAAFPWLFLVGDDTRVKPLAPGRTIAPDGSLFADDAVEPTIVEAQAAVTAVLGAAGEQPAGPQAVLAIPIRKVQTVFPSMITIGRTANNDIVLSDQMVSRFHAYFRPEGDHLELCDAGSRNGTWVDGEKLVPKGKPTSVTVGQRTRFGRLDFSVMTSDGLWRRAIAALGR